jgi:hypothetical protein
MQKTGRRIHTRTITITTTTTITTTITTSPSQPLTPSTLVFYAKSRRVGTHTHHANF